MVLSGGAPPCTAGCATTAERSPLVPWSFWPKPFPLPWPESAYPIAGISKHGCACRVCCHAARRPSSVPGGEPLSSTGPFAGGPELRRCWNHGGRSSSFRLLLAELQPPRFSRRRYPQTEEEVEEVRDGVVPSPIVAGNVAGEPVNFRQGKSRFAQVRSTGLLQYPVSEIFQFWKFPKIASHIYLIFQTSVDYNFFIRAPIYACFASTDSFRRDLQLS